jgi:hypothetical protein
MRLLLIFIFTLFISKTIYSQIDLLRAKNHPIISQKYSNEELEKLYYEDSLKFKHIIIYFFDSYTIAYRKNEYTENPSIIYTKETFDITPFDIYRKEEEDFYRFFEKEGFEITLISYKKMQELINSYILN